MKIRVGALETQTRNFDFVATDFTGHMDFAVIRNSATNNGLSSSHRFRSKVTKSRSIVLSRVTVTKDGVRIGNWIY
jgi:hypothetical protein